MTKDEASHISQWLLDWNKQMRGNTMTKDEEIKLLQETLESARADTKRLDWLADPDQNVGTIYLPDECVQAHPDSLRDAIDAAMALPQDTPEN